MARIKSLDILRGITVAGMIIVNNGYGDSFLPLCHSKWNGMTPCDLVFPFFLFIMGVSTYLSLSKNNFKANAQIITKIIRRAIILFAIGLFINWFEVATKGNWNCFGQLRIWGVMQRIAICYGVVSVVALTIKHKWIIHLIILLLAIYTVIIIVGDGYAQEPSNILARVDTAIFGKEHLYKKSPVDPEGLMSTIPSIAHVLIGFYVGSLLKKDKRLERTTLYVFLEAAILSIAGYLLMFGLPLNKRIWSPSYTLLTCGLAAALLGILMYVVDMKKHEKGFTFFLVFGVNPLFLYVLSELLARTLKRIGFSQVVFDAINSLITHPQSASLTYAIYFLMLNFICGLILYKRKIIIKL